MSRKFEEQFAVVGEWVNRSTLFKLQDHSSYMTNDSIIQNEDFENHYWAIVELDENGWYYETIEDDFNSAEEAWQRYDELRKEWKCPTEK